MRVVGKRVGQCVYVHRDYASSVFDSAQDILRQALKKIRNFDNKYTIVRYNKKTGDVAFIFSPDFDTADEPTVGESILVKITGFEPIVKVTKQQRDPFIWHHKWKMVADDYSGFDVVSSKLHSKLWEPYVTKEEKRKIGRKSYWNKIKKRWEVYSKEKHTSIR